MTIPLDFLISSVQDTFAAFQIWMPLFLCIALSHVLEATVKSWKEVEIADIFILFSILRGKEFVHLLLRLVSSRSLVDASYQVEEVSFCSYFTESSYLKYMVDFVIFYKINWWITLLDFWMLNQLCISKINWIKILRIVLT